MPPGTHALTNTSNSLMLIMARQVCYTDHKTPTRSISTMLISQIKKYK